MCDLCHEPNVILDVRNIHEKTGAKYEAAVVALTKALGYDSERQQKEVSPFRSVRDLEQLSKDRVEKHLLRMYNMISERWLGMEKAKSDTFLLNGRIFLNPKTGRPLTNGQWAIIKKDILKTFGYIYSGEEERIALHALALGKVLKGMSVQDAVNLGYTSLRAQVNDTMSKLTGPLWQNHVAFAQQHAGEMIVNLTQSHYTKIHDTIQNAIIDRKSHRELKDDLFEQFGAMNRDWRRIAETEIGNSQNNGQLLTEIDRAQPDEQILMRGISSSGACPWCRSRVDQKVFALLPAPPDTGETVMVAGTPYTAIWPGKSNFGRKRANWWVAAGTQHPFCRCTWVKYIPGFEDLDAQIRTGMEDALKELQS